MPEVNGIYEDTQVQVNGACIFRHTVLSDHLLSREQAGDRFGWVIGASRRPLYGIRTNDDVLECPNVDWRPLKGTKPAPLVEGFSSLADASLRIVEVWCEEAEHLVNDGRFRHAAEV